MGFVGSMLSNSQGAGFQGSSANILNPASVDQANQLYGQAQSGISQQQAFVNALQAQNGIANQSNVYSQLQGVANGTGPNPATAQLAQATAANTANQAALMAGQRGSSSNAGLIARQAAQQGAANQQNSIGQAASLQAQQSLNAINSMGNLATQQVGQQSGALNSLNQGIQNEQNSTLGAIAAQNNANVGMQSNINNANASIAGINAQGQQQIVGGLIGGAGAALGLAKGGYVPAKADGGSYVADNDPTAPQWAPITPAAPTSQAPAPLPANGVIAPPATSSSAASQGPKSSAGKFLSGYQAAQQPQQGQKPQAMLQAGNAIGNAIGSGIKSIFSSGNSSNAASPDATNAVAQQYFGGSNQSPELLDAITTNAGGAAGSTDLADDALASAAADGGIMSKVGQLAPLLMLAANKGGPVPMKKMDTSKPAKNLKSGGKVPGKAKHSGDTLKNDIVPAMLSPQEIVIPRSIATSPDAPRKAAAFVSAVLAKQRLKR